LKRNKSVKELKQNGVGRRCEREVKGKIPKINK
jgi:hypothetical protein